MNITVAICTWNRCRLLEQTLQHLTKLRIPKNIQWQLVIVDNGSTDDTAQIIDHFREKLPIEYAIQPERGHSISRNTAIEKATGEYILWTDNDVMVDPDWLVNYVDGFRDYPEADYFGGKIIPVFESEMPTWLAETWEKCRAVYAFRDLGEQSIPLGDGVYPYGANFAVRTSVQKQFLFDTKRGRRGNVLTGDDEISMLRRIHSAGHQGRWLPKSVVEHFIPDDRTTTDYISRYFVGQGTLNIVENKVRKTGRQARREAFWFGFRWRLKRFIGSADEWVSHLIRSSLSQGEYEAILAREKGQATSS